VSRQVRAYEAKTHLGRLLDDVERGETIVITRRGRRIARLVPDRERRTSDPSRRQKEIDKAIADIKKLQQEIGSITVEELLSSIHEGHKY
jgi:prevent-host-death family protein